MMFGVYKICGALQVCLRTRFETVHICVLYLRLCFLSCLCVLFLKMNCDGSFIFFTLVEFVYVCVCVPYEEGVAIR